MAGTNLFQIVDSPCSLKSNQWNKDYYIIPPFSESWPPIYAEFTPHMASVSSVEDNWTVRMSHRNDMTLEKFKMWTVPNLKSYLRERDYRVSGTKEYLVAWAFSAWEMKAPVVVFQQEREKILAKSYRDLPIPIILVSASYYGNQKQHK